MKPIEFTCLVPPTPEPLGLPGGVFTIDTFLDRPLWDKAAADDHTWVIHEEGFDEGVEKVTNVTAWRCDGTVIKRILGQGRKATVNGYCLSSGGPAIEEIARVFALKTIPNLIKIRVQELEIMRANLYQWLKSEDIKADVARQWVNHIPAEGQPEQWEFLSPREFFIIAWGEFFNYNNKRLKIPQYSWKWQRWFSPRTARIELLLTEKVIKPKQVE